MKKIVSFLLSLVLLVSCSNENDVLDFAQEPADKPASTIRTPDEALALAKQALNLGTTKSRSNLKLSKNNIVVVGSNPLSRGEASDTVIYAVNSEDNNGFVLVAAPRTCPNPILGIAENGSYNESISENENFNYYMDYARKYAEKVEPVDSTNILIPAYIEETTFYPLGGIVYENVQWGQGWPENLFCPNKIAGCVPVSIAQTLAFFEYPNGIDITYPEATISYLPLNWTELKKHTLSYRERNPSDEQILEHLLNCETSYSTHTTIGHLLRQIGKVQQVIYLDDGTGAFNSGFGTARKFLQGKSLKYSEGTKVIDLFNLFTKHDRNSRCMAMVGGEGPAGGHGWICDGYMQAGTKTRYYERGTHLFVYEKDNTSKYLHMNWGWAGDCDGFFLINVINPAFGYDGLERPKTDITADMDFSSDFGFLFIEPNE